MWTDLEPNDVVVLHYAKGAVSGADAYRAHWVSTSDPFEVQAGVIRVGLKQGVGVSCLLLDVGGQSPVSFPEAVLGERAHG